jgi:hypothetical protein
VIRFGAIVTSTWKLTVAGSFVLLNVRSLPSAFLCS